MDKQDKLIELERPPITETAFLVRLVLPSDSAEDVDESERRLPALRRLRPVP